MSRILVVGGGAAGLMAAGTAVRRGHAVTVLEKNQRPARKVMITGKGRCNLTNACEPTDFLEHVVTNARFLNSALRTFTPQDVMDLFENTLGVPLKVERGNRVFPVSDKAVDVVDALVRYASGADVRCSTTVASLQVEADRVKGVVLANGTQLPADAVILATGGLSYPATGSTGDGYGWAEKAGLTVRTTGPSLVSVVSDDPVCRDLMGLSLKNVTLRVEETASGRCVYSDLGEMLFTHFGLSGPLVLSASCCLRQWPKGGYRAVIDLKPGLTDRQLDERLLRDFLQNPRVAFHNALGRLLPRKLIPVAVKRSGIDPDRPAGQISREQRHSLAGLLKAFTISLTGLRPVDEAVVTYGGVDVKEIDPKTMQSKKVKGLYIVGELLDVDAVTGGFNLQIAWSTGHAAGMAVE